MNQKQSMVHCQTINISTTSNLSRALVEAFRSLPTSKFSKNVGNKFLIFRILERNWKTIRDEALSIIDKDKNSFPLETEDLLDTGDWRQFDLYSQGLIFLTQ